MMTTTLDVKRTAHKHVDLDATIRRLGLRRARNGAYEFPKTHTPRPECQISPRTRENVAACAALGLSYWSDAPGVNSLWAVDDRQRPHVVVIDRHHNTAKDTWTNTVATWSRPATNAEVAALLDENVNERRAA
jgi:hypothetical protein